MKCNQLSFLGDSNRDSVTDERRGREQTGLHIGHRADRKVLDHRGILTFYLDQCSTVLYFLLQRRRDAAKRIAMRTIPCNSWGRDQLLGVRLTGRKLLSAEYLHEGK